MKTKMILACAGMAACATQAQVNRPDMQQKERGESLYPTYVQAIKGVTMDNELVLGEKRLYQRSDNAAARGGITPDVTYNGGAMLDTDGDGFFDPLCADLCAGLSTPGNRWFFGDSFAVQAMADDFTSSAALVDANPKFSGFVTGTNFPSCDGTQGSEPLVILFTMYNSADLVADLDGVNDGFDNDGDGFPDSPYSRTDADGDGLVDEFAGGVVVTFANIDTDGDGINDILDGSGAGYFVLNALELTDDGLGGGLGSEDFGDLPTADLDGNPATYEGTVEIFYTSGEGPDTDGDGEGDGPIFGAFVPSGGPVQTMFWGPAQYDPSGCGPGDPLEATDGPFWGQGQNTCPVGSLNAGAGFSDGASDGGLVNNFWDPSIDLTDNTGVVPCPTNLGGMVTILGEEGSGGTPDRLCADTNQDGLVTPADFNAWIIAFNGGAATVFLCDQNNDGLCTPADFNAWIINFNAGAAGPLCNP